MFLFRLLLLFAAQIFFKTISAEHHGKNRGIATIIRYNELGCAGPSRAEWVLQGDRCVNFFTESFKLVRSAKDDDLLHTDYENLLCHLTLYNGPDCFGGHDDILEIIDIPRDWDTCHHFPMQAGSAILHCRSKDGQIGAGNLLASSDSNITAPVIHAIDSVESDGMDSGESNGIVTVESDNNASSESDDMVFSDSNKAFSESNNNASPESDDMVFSDSNKASSESNNVGFSESDAQTGYNTKYMWLQHFWAGTPACYKCWTKKEFERFDQFQCQVKAPYSSDLCGPMPGTLGSLTRTITSFITTTPTGTKTETVFKTAGPPARVDVADSDWKRRKKTKKTVLIIQNPWFPQIVECARATWYDYDRPATSDIFIDETNPIEMCDLYKKGYAPAANYPPPLYTRTVTKDAFEATVTSTVTYW
ncbi:hypothetical protein DM02DRAFT_679815 [Periconia macrospinosa]|uniref:Uncharacterized protein n=1 Tax=Periconia macrospinosa TaxID=97972 RepID=A0A2V1E9K7_9PLEO|nr:hypothetical protein DM02DRAFT_679815 [Periconia macrospinosa]